MQLRLHQLSSHLASKLAPIYLVSGDEPLQLREALDHIRAAAHAAGFTERTAIQVDASFDWSLLEYSASSLSLFADKRLLDLTIILAGGKIGEAAARAIVDYATRPHPDHMLIMNAGRLEAKTKKSHWYRQVQTTGITVEVWPIPASSLPGWVNERANRLGLRLTDAATLFLAERGEGNLFALAQELDKLYLLHGPAIVDIDQVLSAVADSARFQPFDLVDSTLLGDAPRTVRILRGLREEDIAPQLVLGALTWEVRALAHMARRLGRGERLEQLLNEHRVWRPRRHALQKALDRHLPAHWLDVMAAAAAVDRTIKGRASGNAWDELQQLSLLICGVRIFPYNTVRA
ncbi:MAG: DNA polymerase III subunit delta [Gammaproteobacteria bacterium]